MIRTGELARQCTLVPELQPAKIATVHTIASVATALVFGDVRVRQRYGFYRGR
jgi:hypothetical protein